MKIMKPLYQDIDSERWAREFMEAVRSEPQNLNKQSAQIWFENAIICGYQEAIRRNNAEPWYRRIFRKIVR